MFLFANMFEDKIWYFLNMSCKMEEDDSRLGSMITSNKLGDNAMSKSFQSNWTKATKEKNKTIATIIKQEQQTPSLPWKLVSIIFTQADSRGYLILLHIAGCKQ